MRNAWLHYLTCSLTWSTGLHNYISHCELLWPDMIASSLLVAKVTLAQAATWKDILSGTAAAVLLQLLLGLPFLLQHPGSYLNKAFEFSRIFLLKWSVNWAFLPESIFRSKALAVCLVSTHLGLLLLFAHYKWCQEDGGLLRLLMQRLQGKGKLRATSEQDDVQGFHAKRILAVVFSGNFIGIVCARTLHFQFYSWYFHMLPFLLWHARISTPLRITLFVCIELVWNTFPPSFLSSSLLLTCHLTLLLALWSFSDWSELRQRGKTA